LSAFERRTVRLNPESSSGALSFMLDELKRQADERAELERRKLAEMRESVKRDWLADPITASIGAWAAAHTILAGLAFSAVSAGISLGTSLLVRALTPAQKVIRGQLSGDLQVPQSEQGLVQPEGYGADPGDGKGGGFRCGFIIPWADRIVKHVTKTKQTGGGGGKGPKPAEVTDISYSISLALMGSRGPVTFKRVYAGTDKIYNVIGAGPTGVYNPVVPPDDGYAPNEPPNPNTIYTRPFERFDGELTPDVGGSSAGVINAGGMANLTLYPGSDDQPVDPTIEADVNARLGAGSTPAYRGRSLVVLKDFYLTKYGGSIPPFYHIAEHQTLTTLEDIYGHWCERVGLLSSDYDFTALSGVNVRGLLINQRYAPKDVMEQLARIYNVNLFEADKIYGTLKAGASAVATIDDSELGWIDGEQGDDESAPVAELETTIETETNIVRRVEVKYIDPAKDFEPNLQAEHRQTTAGERPETIEVQLTLAADEAREIAQRELYDAEVRATSYKGTLTWTYVWLKPGDVINVPRDEGFTESIRITRIVPTIGLIEFEGEPTDVAVFTQPVSTWPGDVIEPPPVGVPAMTVAGFYDGPPLRDAEEAGVGFYAWAVKRRGDGDFTGSALYVDRGLGYEGPLATFDKEATSGVCATALTGTTSIYGFVVDELTVDLHNATDTLESYTEADLLNGAGVCIVGDEVCQILTADREPDTESFPNRWYLTIGLRAKRGTFYAIGLHSAGERFVVVSDAVKFVRVDPDEVGLTRTYRMVTSGQSVDDAAPVEFTFTGMKGRYTEPSSLILARTDATTGSPLLIRWGLPSGSQLSADERYVVKIYSGSTVIRKHTVQANYSEPVQFQFRPVEFEWEDQSLLTISEDGTLEMAANAEQSASVRSTQAVLGDSRVTWRLDSRNPPFFLSFVGALTSFTLEPSTNEIIVPDHAFEEGDEFNPKSGIPAGLYPVVNAKSDRFQIATTPGGAPIDLSSYAAGTFNYPSPPTAIMQGVESGGTIYVRAMQSSFFQAPAVAGAEYSIELRNGVVYFYLIDQQTPRCRSAGPAARWPYEIWVSMGFIDGAPQAALRMTIRHANARSFLYTREMQEDDFGVGSVPATATVSVSRLSAVGEGREAFGVG
jgi:hypothetical protein